MDAQAKDRYQQIVGLGGFDRTLAGLELLEVKDGRCLARLPVSDGVKNLGGKLHGGATATLVDVVGTIAILSRDKESRPGVSTDLNVSFFAPGEGAVVIEAVVLKSGRSLAFVTVDIRREADHVLVAQGRMTKFL